jgi:DNA-binding transcriptional ArsR family regulator
VSDKRPKKDAVEVSSQPIQDELAAIKDRLNAIETIQSISNAAVVKQFVQEHLKTKDAKRIMKECEEPKTRSQLQTTFGYKSGQALDHHLKPLREADLIRQKIEGDRTIVFEWSNLFRRLPKSTIRSILGDSK